MKYDSVPLSEVCDLLAGYAFKSQHFGEYSDKVIKITNITPPTVDMNHLTGVDIKQYNIEKLKKYIVHRGDYVLAMTGATIGKIGRIHEGEAFINQRVLTFRPKSTIDADYLYYCLQGHYFSRYIINHIDSESAQPNISANTIGKYELALPNIDTQRNAASFLKSLDDKIELNNRINENLEQQAQAVFLQEFLSFDSVPVGWHKSSLLGIADYLNGLAMQKFRPKDGEQGIPVLKIKELRQGACDESSELCSPSIKPEYIVHDGDVVFSWSGSLLVDFWCGGDCGLNQHLFKVTSEKYDKWFYYAWTKHYLQEFAAIAADMATTMGHIKRGELSKAEVLIPPQAEYERIGGLLAPIYELIIANRIENRKLAALRDTMLPKLMSGEINVSEVLT